MGLNDYRGAKRTLSKGILTFSLLVGTSLSALAQLPTAQERAATGQANPGRVQEQILDGDQLFAPGPKIHVKDLVLQNMPANADKIRFKLSQIEFEGVGVYDKADIQPLYASKLGTTVTLADVYAIATAMTNKYRNDGYILTQVIVPPQTIDGGRVKLRAVEGFVDKIAVTGDDQNSALKTIRAYARRVQSNGALNVEDLEKFLLLINDLPGVEARSILSPSKTTTGASDLRIIVERDPYDAFLGVDNYGSRYLGPIQFTAAGSVNSYFGNNERISSQLVAAPHNSELYFVSLGYDQPIGTYGTKIKTLYSHSNTEPGYDLDQFDVRGKSDFASVQVEHPFMRTRERSFYGSVGIDFRDVQSRNDLEPTREDRIRTLRVGGRYEFLDNLFTAGVNALSLTFSQGLNILGASSEGDIRVSRPAADPTFFKMNVEAQRLQRLTSDVNMLFAARAQMANDALLSSEEFGVGGINSGRGYDPSEIVGEDGVSGSLEVQWNRQSPWTYVEDYQLFGFYDIGKVWNDDATISDDDESLASVGFGVRADLVSDMKAALSVAFPLTRDVQTQSDDDPKVYFSLNRSF
ncbi:MAG: ShlB/FhaC/HecB family hemolysin secretion/activation protein [Rhodospirillales bacterium]|nr:ShlB/FhaC/HecB family hemolysin secretion/activation protein [Alphaproteobacteria bacterium]USO06736.1 MAG: ShlB/FhaC/HecB family hemolysin secretion/activation protein [Rhodospirillales bacterium]